MRFSASSSEVRASGGASGIGLLGVVRFVLRKTRRGKCRFNVGALVWDLVADFVFCCRSKCRESMIEKFIVFGKGISGYWFGYCGY